MADDLDISDEVIDFFENLGNDEPSAIDENEVVAEETPTEVTEEVAPTEEVVEEEVSNEEEVVAEEQEEETPAEDATWEQRYKDLQSQKDKEVLQVQNQLAQMQEWAQRQYEWTQQVQPLIQQAQQAQAPAPPQVTAEELSAAIDNDIVGSFQWVAANRPDLVPTMASMVRENEKFGHRVADQMLFEYNQYEIARAEASRAEQVQQSEAPAQVEQAMGQIIQSLEGKFGDTFTGLREEIAAEAAAKAPMFKQYMAQHNLEITPQAVADYVSGVYFDIREARTNQQVAQPRKAQKLTPDQYVENASALTQVEETSDQTAINEIMAGARNLGIDVAPTS